MPGTVDGFMTSLCISLMTTQTANLQQKVLGCTRGRSARGRELPWRAAAPGFKRMPQQGADIVARIAVYGQTDFGRIEIQAPEASNQTVKQRTGLHVANQLQHYQPASFPAWGQLAGIILSIRTFTSSIAARYPIATAVRPRLAQRRAYTAFPSNFLFGEADGHASVQNALFILAHALGYAHCETIIYSK